MAERPRIVHTDDVYRLAFWRNVVIVDVAGNIDVERMRRLGRAYKDLLTAHPTGIVACAFIRAGVPVAPADARNESVRFMRELGDSIISVAIVIEERGVFANILHTVIRGINVLARNSKLVVFRTLDDAVSAVASSVSESTAGGDAATELRAAIGVVRADYRPEQQRSNENLNNNRINP